MTRDDFLRELEEALTMEAGSLTPDLQLEDAKEWDSLGVVEFQSLVDEKFQVQVPPPQITSCKSVKDLLDLVGDRFEG